MKHELTKEIQAAVKRNVRQNKMHINVLCKTKENEGTRRRNKCVCKAADRNSLSTNDDLHSGSYPERVCIW